MSTQMVHLIKIERVFLGQKNVKVSQCCLSDVPQQLDVAMLQSDIKTQVEHLVCCVCSVEVFNVSCGSVDLVWWFLRSPDVVLSQTVRTWTLSSQDSIPNHAWHVDTLASILVAAEFGQPYLANFFCGGGWVGQWARRVGARNFALFFSLSPAGNFILPSLSGGSSRGILVVFLKAGALKCARPKAAGVSHDNQRTPNVHISGPRRFKHHQNSTRRPPGKRKKRANFWAVRRRRGRPAEEGAVGRRGRSGRGGHPAEGVQRKGAKIFKTHTILNTPKILKHTHTHMTKTF